MFSGFIVSPLIVSVLTISTLMIIVLFFGFVKHFFHFFASFVLQILFRTEKKGVDLSKKKRYNKEETFLPVFMTSYAEPLQKTVKSIAKGKESTEPC